MSCTRCKCADCEREATTENPLYTALFEALSVHGQLWEGDAHAVAELAIDMTGWLRTVHAGSFGVEIGTDRGELT